MKIEEKPVETTVIEKDRLQELLMIEGLFYKQCRRELPLQEIWNQENKEYLEQTFGKEVGFVVPDATELMEWTVKTLKDLIYHKQTTVGLWAIDKDPKELLELFNKQGENFDLVSNFEYVNENWETWMKKDTNPFIHIEYKEIKE
jgi:hypothetical protein